MARGPMGGGMGGRGMGGPNSFDPNRRRPKQPVGKTLLRLWKYLAGQQKKLIGLMVIILIGNVAGLLAPKVVGEAINAIGLGKGEADFPKVYVCCITLIVLYVTTDLLSYLNSRGIHKLTRDLSVHLRQDVYNKLMSLPVRYFDERQTGDILSVISYDVDTMIRSISSDVLTTITATVTLIICLVMMFTILPTLVLVFLVTIPISILFARWINKTVHPLFRQRSIKRGMLNGYAEEMTSGQKTTRAYGREQQVIDGFETKNREAVQASNAAEIRSSFLGSGTSFINNFSMTLVSVFGGILLLSGKAMLGDVSAFVQYSRRFVGPIREVSNILGELQAALAAAERVFDLLDEEPEALDTADATELVDAQGSVELDHVKFGYVPGKTIIKDLSLHAKPGSLVAIVGPTGAGKTTIINLLMRFYDIDSGEIRVDGHNISRLTRRSLRRAYTMVLQETWLFHGTIFENIAYGKEGVTMEEVVAAAQAAGIHDYIRQLPEGYNTVITGGGTGISKGQKQMITIARAMLMDSNMLILDEATSNVDTRTEQKLQTAMRKLMKDRTCFVIAHRLSTIRHADDILVVRDGNVVEQGDHDALMAQNGFYASLYHAQFESY